MTYPVFPSLPGQGWSVLKQPTFSTLLVTQNSGRETRFGLSARTQYEFEVLFDGLDSSGLFPGLTTSSLQTFLAFFMTCQGQLQPFLYQDPTDYSVTAQTFGTGDGTTRTFTLGRTIGSNYAAVSYINTITSLTVAGTPTSSYTISYPNSITFTTAPAASATLAWTGTYSFLCRFLIDKLDLTCVASSLWQCKSVKFRQIR